MCKSLISNQMLQPKTTVILAHNSQGVKIPVTNTCHSQIILTRINIIKFQFYKTDIIERGDKIFYFLSMKVEKSPQSP